MAASDGITNKPSPPSGNSWMSAPQEKPMNPPTAPLHRIEPRILDSQLTGFAEGASSRSRTVWSAVLNACSEIPASSCPQLPDGQSPLLQPLVELRGFLENPRGDVVRDRSVIIGALGVIHSRPPSKPSLPRLRHRVRSNRYVPEGMNATL